MSAVSAAYSRLADYMQRCRDYAEPLPLQEDLVRYWSGIGFTLGDAQYVAPLDQVSEILSLPDYTRVPGVLNWMKGVANVRGRLMTLMDLMRFLGRTPTLNDKSRRLLVLDEGEIYTGLQVDEVLGMQHFPVDSYAEQPQEPDEAVKPYIEGAYLRDGEQWWVFSLLRLADDPRFLQVTHAS